MIGVIIATHGTMAGAALDLCKMLTGEKEKVETIGFDTPEDLAQAEIYLKEHGIG